LGNFCIGFAAGAISGRIVPSATSGIGWIILGKAILLPLLLVGATSILSMRAVARSLTDDSFAAGWLGTGIGGCALAGVFLGSALGEGGFPVSPVWIFLWQLLAALLLLGLGRISASARAERVPLCARHRTWYEMQSTILGTTPEVVELIRRMDPRLEPAILSGLEKRSETPEWTEGEPGESNATLEVWRCPKGEDCAPVVVVQGEVGSGPDRHRALGKAFVSPLHVYRLEHPEEAPEEGTLPPPAEVQDHVEALPPARESPLELWFPAGTVAASALWILIFLVPIGVGSQTIWPWEWTKASRFEVSHGIPRGQLIVLMWLPLISAALCLLPLVIRSPRVASGSLIVVTFAGIALAFRGGWGMAEGRWAILGIAGFLLLTMLAIVPSGAFSRSGRRGYQHAMIAGGVFWGLLALAVIGLVIYAFFSVKPPPGRGASQSKLMILFALILAGPPAMISRNLYIGGGCPLEEKDRNTDPASAANAVQIWYLVFAASLCVLAVVLGAEFARDVRWYTVALKVGPYQAWLFFTFSRAISDWMVWSDLRSPVRP
jgi:hypothetical protein